MTSGIKTVIYPVRDLARVTMMSSKLLGAEPATDQAYYVGFSAGDQEIGLDPHGHRQGVTANWHVSDIRDSLGQLIDTGAKDALTKVSAPVRPGSVLRCG
jgi:hypothetical protein